MCAEDAMKRHTKEMRKMRSESWKLMISELFSRCMLHAKAAMRRHTLVRMNVCVYERLCISHSCSTDQNDKKWICELKHAPSIHDASREDGTRNGLERYCQCHSFNITEHLNLSTRTEPNGKKKIKWTKYEVQSILFWAPFFFFCLCRMRQRSVALNQLPPESSRCFADTLPMTEHRRHDTSNYFVIDDILHYY